MKANHFLTALFILVFVNSPVLHAQRDMDACKVTSKNLVGQYTGGCKDGLADGKGEARGIDHYVGSFKKGMPNGSGTMYYGENEFFTGKFLDGLKEGRGEKHFLRKGMPDSVVKGFWSADEFRGNTYTTYKFNTTILFDHIEITPSDNSGNSVTFEIATTSGSPNGVPNHANSAGFNSGSVLTIRDLLSPTSSIIKAGSQFASAYKSSITYELTGFPCKLLGTFSNGETFELELYKSANWKLRFFLNQ